MSAKWCCRLCSAISISLVANGYLLINLGLVFIVVSFPSNHRCLVKVMRRLRRWCHPLQTYGMPRIWSGVLAISQRPHEVNHWQHIPDRQHGRASGGQHVEYLELRWIRVVAAWHSQVADNELREKCQVKTNKHKQRRELRPSLRIQLAGHLRPPEVQPRQVGQNHAAHHHVMEMRHHKVSIGHVHVDTEGRQEHSGKAANRE